jgi:hypothetical protein
MTAVDDWIANLRQFRSAEGNLPVICDYDTMVAGIEFLQSQITSIVAGGSGMKLLAAVNYDPAVAVNKSTAALLAMTALDTVNLRLPVTVPSHGSLRFHMRGTVRGAATNPQLMLGVMNGATVVGRQVPKADMVSATRWVEIDADFTVDGLAPGAANFDAAYAVQIVVAATMISYGGPDNNAGNNAFGGFLFEIYNPTGVD